MMTYEFVILLCLFFFLFYRQNETRQWCRNIEKAIHGIDRDIARTFNKVKKMDENLLAFGEKVDILLKE